MVKSFSVWLFLFSISFANGQIKVETFRFAASSGDTLEQHVYFPNSNTLASFPVVLIRTPYGKDQYRHDGFFFASQGYVTVIQDTRGKFGSSGHFIPFIYETSDGLATLNWLQQQSWCDGNVGIYGISYSGFCGLTLADEMHPVLKTLINFSGWVEPEIMAAPGGSQHLMLNIPWLLHEETQTRRDLEEYDIDSLFWHLPIAETFSHIGIKSDAWEDPDLLGTVNQDFKYDRVNIPILHLTGAYDFVKEGTLGAYSKIAAYSNSQQKLIFGPWFHNQSHTSLTEVGEIDFGPNSIMGDDKVLDIAIQWFDEHLKRKKEEPTLPQTNVFLMFDNNWYEFDQWPSSDMNPTVFYLNSKKGANSIYGDGQLNLNPSDGNIKDEFIYHPDKPVPTCGGANFHFLPQQLGIKDQSIIEERKDVLVYTSSPFSSPQAVMGGVTVRLYASSSAPDTDFTAKLVLVTPEGMAMNIVDGIVRARHRHSIKKHDLLIPNKVYSFEIDLGSTAFLIPQGYQLRLEISSSNFPKFSRNTNTKEDPFYSSFFKSATQKIYHSLDYPSQLILHTMPFEKLITINK
ncbi:MAG: CocE/NonD family hydrolase [Bacteroidota bacterium]